MRFKVHGSTEFGGWVWFIESYILKLAYTLSEEREDIPSNSPILSLLRIGAFLFCSRLNQRCLYLAGHKLSVDIQGGMERYDPVIGGDIFSSRYICVKIAVKFAPALIPPTKKPFDGFPPSCVKFSEVYHIISYSLCQRNTRHTHFKAS